MSVREPQVENAIKFLTNPKVANAPLSQKLAFLQNKGLTEKEVAESLRRASAQAAAAGSDGVGGGGDGGDEAWGSDGAGDLGGGSSSSSRSSSVSNSSAMPRVVAAAPVPAVQYVQVPSLAARPPSTSLLDKLAMPLTILAGTFGAGLALRTAFNGGGGPGWSQLLFRRGIAGRQQ